MSKIKMNEVVLRTKRQVTLPKEICNELGIEPGDTLELKVENSALIARPRKSIALEALKEIRQAFRRSGITEKDFQEAGYRIREEITRAKYNAKI